MSDATASKKELQMEELVSLCVRRGFIFQSSEIYGGINGFWDYGPLGVELKNNLKSAWWNRVVRQRDDVEGLDSSIVAHPRTWEASGHVAHFTDPMVDCKKCKRRFRADQLPSGPCPASSKGDSDRNCDFTVPRNFNLMLQTQIGASEDAASAAYLRPETCQSIFTDFRRVKEVARQKIPFGIAQIGKAFRNEINPRNFNFRSREFEQAELEFFVRIEEREEWFAYWLEERLKFHRSLGFKESNLRTRPHAEDELAHYAKAAADVEFLFPFGWQEIEGIHDRGTWDLDRHTEFSGKDLSITDEATKERFVPSVIETSVGIDRTTLALLANGYEDELLANGESRVVMHIAPHLAPYTMAVLPLSKKVAEPAERVVEKLRRNWNVFFDVSGNIGRRYRRQDEIGTPYCLTYDFDSQEDDKVTIRDRDTMEQERVPIDSISMVLNDRLSTDLT